jgi:glycosyltransferase involved in cell wall biosynthesis
LIRAAAELYSRGNRFKLLIIGGGEEEGAIARAIREHGAASYVRVLQRVPHQEIGRYYSIVDVMVFPRLRVRLTELVTPLKPLEAMSLEKAVLASDVGGHRELLQDGHTGLLFRPQDVADFCLQAKRLISDPLLRRQLGQQGRAMVLRDKDWKVLARRYQGIYDFVTKYRGSAATFVPESVAGPCNT